METRTDEERAAIRSMKKAICERQDHSKGLRRRAQQSSGTARSDILEDKSYYGVGTRYLLAAYALLRGVDFARVEPSSKTPLQASIVYSRIREHMEPAGAWNVAAEESWTPKNVGALLGETL